MNRSRMLQGFLSQPNYLLDSYSGAVGAYSLRYLSGSFVGNDVVLVRRSSDNAEQGFTPLEITDGTLATFCGAGDGLVKTWYDQSGNDYNLSQTTLSKQPKIVNNGVVLIDTNSLPIVDNSNGFLFNLSAYWGSFEEGNKSFFSVLEKSANVANVAIHIGTESTESSNFIYFGGDYEYRGTNINVRFNGVGTSGASLFSLFDVVGKDSYVDGVAQAPSTPSLSSVGANRLEIFARRNGSLPISAYAQEIIIYNSDQSEKRLDIETEINDYYNVF